MSTYLRFELENIEPLRVADDNVSQSGQTATLRFIPGTAIRGVVVNYASGQPDFVAVKKILLSDRVRFLNAYLKENDRELIPSPKGFYEDKTTVKGAKKIENVVVTGDITEGNKRASLGRYAYIDQDCIRYYSVPTGSDMKIKINIERSGDKQTVFRNEYILPGHIFVGYIVVDDDSVKEVVKAAFQSEVRIGNARTQGMGKCRLISAEYVENHLPYEGYAPQNDVEHTAYMMLLSNTCMRDYYGEPAGINLQALSELMGVKNLRIDMCSTSTVDVCGYNRTCGSKVPSVTMYEQGSVFRLSFDGVLKQENIRKIMDSGIGMRKNEGCGRVLFLNNYEQIGKKLEGERMAGRLEVSGKRDTDDDTLRLIARNTWLRLIRQKTMEQVLSNPLGRCDVSNSQIGMIESKINLYRYNYVEAQKELMLYFSHAEKKEDRKKVHTKTASIKSIEGFITNVLNRPLWEVCGIEEGKRIIGFSMNDLMIEEEQGKCKLEYIIESIHFYNREGGQN